MHANTPIQLHAITQLEKPEDCIRRTL